MALVQKAITGLYKGVSRQDKTNRIEGQVEESINMMHSIEKGVARRNPTELLRKLPDVTDQHGFLHSYSRGDLASEEYLIYITDGKLKVFRALDGVELIVKTTTDSYKKLMEYLSVGSGMAHKTFKALTVGDTTFIINRSKTCKMRKSQDGSSAKHEFYPFYWIKRSFDNGRGAGYFYRMNDQEINATSTTYASSALKNALNTAESTDKWLKYGSIIVYNGRPNRFDWSDSYGSQASQGVNGSIPKIRDLPNNMSGADKYHDFLVEVQGDPDNKFTSYWVEYKNGYWQETRKSGLFNEIDKFTMPIKLVRGADGHFNLSFIDYAERLVGDTDTAQEPSFIGQTIQDVFFFKNRLCFIAGENVIMSRIGDYFNFFPRTVTDVLDNDPIDVAVDSNNVSLLNHAIPFNNSVILLSNRAQFSLSADKVVSPNDVSVTSTTNYACDEAIVPVALGNSLYFISKGLQDVALREYYVDSSGASNIAVDVSRHAGGYVPNHLINMVGNSNQNILFTLSHSTRDTLYVYKYFNDGQERVQTAWFKWKFSGTIYNIALLEDYLYILIDRGSGVQLERIDYNTSGTHSSYMDNGSINYTSSLELSEVVLKDSNGALIQSAKSPIMYKTFILTSTDDSNYQVRIENKLRVRSAKGFAKKDNKVLVQGKTSETKVIVKSVVDNPLEFHTYTFEMNYNLRAQVV